MRRLSAAVVSVAWPIIRYLRVLSQYLRSIDVIPVIHMNMNMNMTSQPSLFSLFPSPSHLSYLTLYPKLTTNLLRQMRPDLLSNIMNINPINMAAFALDLDGIHWEQTSLFPLTHHAVPRPGSDLIHPDSRSDICSGYTSGCHQLWYFFLPPIEQGR